MSTPQTPLVVGSWFNGTLMGGSSMGVQGRSLFGDGLVVQCRCASTLDYRRGNDALNGVFDVIA